MALSTYEETTHRAPANHSVASKYQFETPSLRNIAVPILTHFDYFEVLESLSASSDIVLGSSFDNTIGLNSLGIKKPIRVWFDANRKLVNRKSFELEIGTPACIFDSKTNQWQRFISTQITHNSVSSFPSNQTRPGSGFGLNFGLGTLLLPIVL